VSFAMIGDQVCIIFSKIVAKKRADSLFIQLQRLCGGRESFRGGRRAAFRS
jgi:hypothetical protein